jgi:hypothetical protein
MDSYHIDPVSFPEAICKRPKMWTATGRLEEVMALFDGYRMAICRHEITPKNEPTPSDALEWFHQQSSERWPAQQVKKLRSKYGSDEEVLKALLEYLKQMRLDQDNPQK